MPQTDLDLRCINTLRFLAVDAVEKAQSGHAGAPMGAAAAAFALWDRVLKHNPGNPAWPDRDRFVLSAGHASLLLYGLLHLTGYDLPLDELRTFRQWGSRTPGHPERGHTPGVEVTTGPLGQGFANGVGLAIAERRLAAQFNRPGHAIVDHFTYGLVSDGDLQEGVASEAASLAGTLGLGKLIYLYDSNGIQIEGSTQLAFREDVGRRFEAYGWQVLGPVDGLRVEEVEAALRQAQADPERPSLLIVRTIIGYGSPTQGTAKVHSDALGEANVRAAKAALEWPVEPTFLVPGDVAAHMGQAADRGSEAEKAWQGAFSAYAAAYPDLASRFEGQFRGELPPGWDEALAGLLEPGPVATREASGAALNALAVRTPALLGGSGDLAPSTKTTLSGLEAFDRAHPAGRNFHFGVREHAMGAVANGIAAHGGCIPFAATFFAFSDYLRPPLRLAAMMGLRVVYVFTHDSIGLGEDGPTHQPVEQLMNLRAVPHLTVIRPADGAETLEAWRAALLNDRGPTALVLSRQKVPALDGPGVASPAGLHQGGYALWDSGQRAPEVILLGTGSEVHIALDAGRRLAAEGIGVRVVSLPSWELFDRQSAEYRESVLPGAVRARVSVEAGVTLGWEHYVGLEGGAVGLGGFGASAPAKVLFEKFGITVEAVVARARALVQRRAGSPDAPPLSSKPLEDAP